MSPDSRLLGVTPRAVRRVLVVFLATCLILYSCNSQQSSAQSFAQLTGTNYSQNFDSLIVVGSSSSSLPTGLAFVEAGASANNNYAANDGSSATENTYSYGTGTSAERAFGELTGPDVQSTIGVGFINASDHVITSFLVSYTGEQWRLGAADASLDRLDFQFSTNATALNNGTWNNVDALDFVTPNNAGPIGVKNGNLAANRTLFAPFAITPASGIQNGSKFFIRWVPTNIAGEDDGLAIDDLIVGTALAPGLPGDFNEDDVVDAADYVFWRNNLGPGSLPNENGASPGVIDGADYVTWRAHFGNVLVAGSGSGNGSAVSSISVPEPASGVLATIFLMVWSPWHRRGRS